MDSVLNGIGKDGGSADRATFEKLIRSCFRSGAFHAQGRRPGFNANLISGIRALTHPDYHKLNEHAGRNDRLLHAVLCAYAKHIIGSEDIGWSGLGEILHDVICNEIGDDDYCAWAERIKTEESQ